MKRYIWVRHLGEQDLASQSHDSLKYHELLAKAKHASPGKENHVLLQMILQNT